MSALDEAMAALERVKAAKVSPDGMPSPEEDGAEKWKGGLARVNAKPVEKPKPSRPLPKAAKA